MPEGIEEEEPISDSAPTFRPGPRERIRSIEGALERSPEEVRLHLRLGWENLRLAEDLGFELDFDETDEGKNRALRNAVGALEEVLVRDPRNVCGYRLLAHAYQELGALEGETSEDDEGIEATFRAAERACEGGRKHAPLDPTWGRVQGKLHVLRADRRAGREEDPTAAAEAAVRALEESLLRDPESYVSWAELGIAHSAMRRPRGRRAARKGPVEGRALREAVRADPNDADARLRLGAVLLADEIQSSGRRPRRERKLAEAARCFARAAALSPGDPLAWFGRGVAWRVRGDLRREAGREPGGDSRAAARFLERAIQAEPAFARAHLQLGLARRGLAEALAASQRPAGKAFGAACRALEEARRLDPDDPEAIIALGEARLEWARWLRERKRNARQAYADAVQILAERVRRDPDDTFGWYYYGGANREWASTLTIGRRVDREAYVLGARAYEEAARAFEQVRQLDADDILIRDQLRDAYEGLAWARSEAGLDPREAHHAVLRELRRRLQKDPDEFYTVLRVGETYAALAQWERDQDRDPQEWYRLAIRTLEEARPRAPKDLPLTYELGDPYKQLAQWQADHGIDPRDAFERAVGAYLRDRRDSLSAYFNVTDVLESLTAWMLVRGGDGKELYLRILGSYREALNRGDAETRGVHAGLLGTAWLDLAAWQAQRGEDPGPSLDRAAEALAAAVAAKKSSPFWARGRRAEVELRKADLRRERGDDARALYERTLRTAEAALEKEIAVSRKARGGWSTLLVIGRACRALGDLRRARRAFRAALKRESDTPRLEAWIRDAKAFLEAPGPDPGSPPPPAPPPVSPCATS